MGAWKRFRLGRRGLETAEGRAENRGRQAASSPFQLGLFISQTAHTARQKQLREQPVHTLHLCCSRSPKPHTVSQMARCTKFKPSSLRPQQISVPKILVYRYLGHSRNSVLPKILTAHLLHARRCPRTQRKGENLVIRPGGEGNQQMSRTGVQRWRVQPSTVMHTWNPST